MGGIHMMGCMTKLAFHESTKNAGRSLTVDRRNGVIRNVKVLGLISENNRRYLPEAVKKSIPLYENIAVNIDHPDRQADDSRSAYDRFGKLENVRFVENEGLFGDLFFLKSHPMAERICEAAERMPDMFGLSHNADGDGETRDGVFVVEKIIGVRHVDVVADPATTKSLSESKMLEDTSGAYAGNVALDPPAGSNTGATVDNMRFDKRVRFLVQNGWKQKGGSFVGAGSTQMLPNKDIMRLSDDKWQWVEFKVKNKYTESKTEAKMDDGVKEALAALTAAVQKLADCYSDDMDGMDSMDEAKEPMDGEAEPDGDEKDKKPMEAVDPDTAKEIEGGDKKEMYHNKESRQSNASLLRENTKLRNIERVRQLCESSRVATTRELLEDLSGLSDEACKRQVARLATATNRPRSAGYQAVKPANGVPTGMDLGSYLTN
jgi:hypothetical protein